MFPLDLIAKHTFAGFVLFLLSVLAFGALEIWLAYYLGI